jgi:hypothetical protein
MDILEMLGLEHRIKQAQKESPQERYARIEIDLGAPENVGKNIKISISGDYLSKIKYNGSATGCYFKFGNKRSSKIYAAEFRKRHTPFIEFDCIYLTNPVAQTGKEFTLFVGGAFAGEIEPSTGIKTGLTDSDGVDVDPVDDRRYKAHDFGNLKPTTMTAANTAQPLIAASTKVKWAIIHTLSKVTLIGDSTVTRGGGVNDGQKYGEDVYISVEYVDLSEIYIINYVLGEQCIYSINYVKEEA